MAAAAILNLLLLPILVISLLFPVVAGYTPAKFH